MNISQPKLRSEKFDDDDDGGGGGGGDDNNNSNNNNYDDDDDDDNNNNNNNNRLFCGMLKCDINAATIQILYSYNAYYF